MSRQKNRVPKKGKFNFLKPVSILYNYTILDINTGVLETSRDWSDSFTTEEGTTVLGYFRIMQSLFYVIPYTYDTCSNAKQLPWQSFSK